MIKVYATVGNQNNLITTIPFKGVNVRVEFSGGNSMKNIPAKLFTRDPFVMKALDSSDQLGRLYIVYKIIEEEGDKAPEPAGESAGSARGTTVVGQEPAPAPDAPEPPAQEPEPVNANQEVSAGEGDGSGTGGKLEFENLAEAVTYIATKYGEQVESDSQARRFIEEKEGRKAIIHKG